MNKHKLRLKRERRKKRAAERAAAAQPIIDGTILLKMFDQRLDQVFGKVSNPLIVGLSVKTKNKV
jgi:hypothetical protein